MADRDYKPLNTFEMREKGWKLAPSKHPESPSRCKSCDVEIEWWISPKGKNVPFDPVESGDTMTPRVSHFATCPNAAQHRGQGQQSSTASSGTYKAAQIPALAEMQRTVKAEFDREHPNCTDLTLKINWLFRKLCETRVELDRRKAGCAQGAGR